VGVGVGGEFLQGIYHSIAVFNHFKRTLPELPLQRGSHLSWFPHSTARTKSGGWKTQRKPCTVLEEQPPFFLREKIVSEVISRVS